MIQEKKDEVNARLEVSREEYLERLSVDDRENLRAVENGFRETLSRMSRKGNLFAVGGTIREPLPRKDIDVIVALEPHSTDRLIEQFPTRYDHAVAEFEIHRKIVKQIVKKSNGVFQILQETPPAIDHMGDPEGAHLRHSGSITLKTDSTPIELIRTDLRTDEIKKKMTKPFVQLS